MPLVGFHVFSLEKHPNLDPTTPEILQLGGGIQKNPSVLSMVSSYKPMHSKQTQMAGKRKEPQKKHSSSLQCCTVFPLKPIYRLFSCQSQCCWIERIQNAFCILLPPISGTCFSFATVWSVKEKWKEPAARCDSFPDIFVFRDMMGCVSADVIGLSLAMFSGHGPVIMSSD